MIDLPPEMGIGRPSVIDDWQGVKISSQVFANPPSTFVDALRVCVQNKIACSFMPKVAESVEVVTMQETTDRGGKHELYVVYRSYHDLPDAT